MIYIICFLLQIYEEIDNKTNFFTKKKPSDNVERPKLSAITYVISDSYLSSARYLMVRTI